MTNPHAQCETMRSNSNRFWANCVNRNNILSSTNALMGIDCVFCCRIIIIICLIWPRRVDPYMLSCVPGAALRQQNINNEQCASKSSAATSNVVAFAWEPEAFAHHHQSSSSKIRCHVLSYRTGIITGRMNERVWRLQRLSGVDTCCLLSAQFIVRYLNGGRLWRRGLCAAGILWTRAPPTTVKLLKALNWWAASETYNTSIKSVNCQNV